MTLISASAALAHQQHQQHHCISRIRVSVSAASAHQYQQQHCISRIRVSVSVATISTSNASCFFHLCQQHQHIPLIYSSELEGISAHLYINLINISLPSHFLDAIRHTKDNIRRHQTSSETCQAMPGSGSVMIYRALHLIWIVRQGQ